MRRRLAHEAGVTMIELLVAMALMTVVLGTTLLAYEGLQDDHLTTERHTEAATKARFTMQRLARELRNLASPTTLGVAAANQPQAIDRAEPFDLIFRTVDSTMPVGSLNRPNVMRVRYCLTENPSNKRRWRIWIQTQKWTAATTPSTPNGTSCPAPGWDTQAIHTTEVVNATSGGSAVPAFTYAPACVATSCTTAEMQRITKIRTQLVIDNDPDKRPTAARLTSSVILRNQNQFPSAGFTVTVLDNNRNIRLDASSSSDPEGQPLKYCWFRNATLPLPACSAASANAAYIGEGVVLSHRVPTAGTHAFYLRVEDPAGLSNWPTFPATQTMTFS